MFSILFIVPEWDHQSLVCQACQVESVHPSVLTNPSAYPGYPYPPAVHTLKVPSTLPRLPGDEAISEDTIRAPSHSRRKTTEAGLDALRQTAGSKKWSHVDQEVADGGKKNNL